MLTADSFADEAFPSWWHTWTVHMSWQRHPRVQWQTVCQRVWRWWWWILNSACSPRIALRTKHSWASASIRPLRVLSASGLRSRVGGTGSVVCIVDIMCVNIPLACYTPTFTANCWYLRSCIELHINTKQACHWQFALGTSDLDLLTSG